MGGNTINIHSDAASTALHKAANSHIYFGLLLPTRAQHGRELRSAIVWVKAPILRSRNQHVL